MIKLLAKANDDVLSHCGCVAPMASVPGQLDCPWCGCGWLIGCTVCKKVFTYACVVEADTEYKTFVRSDFEHRGYKNIEDVEIEACAAWLEDGLADFAVGQKVVYLDGVYFPLEGPVEAFEGLYANHDFARLPHAVALEDSDHLRAVLGEKSYWLDRERPGRADEL
jgi:hypothetical protein